MKTMLGPIGLKAGFVTATVCHLLAQDPCAVDTWGLAHLIEDVRCTPTDHWTRPVDLDGDGTPEFHHARFDLIQFYNNGTQSFYETRDNREGFFAAEHVEVYAVNNWQYREFISPELPQGQTIPPNPPPVGEWDPLWTFNPPFSLPYLQAYGLGWVWRNTDRAPCYVQPWECQGQDLLGLLARALEARTYVALAGFRVRQSDGWHLGWLRLHWDPDYTLDDRAPRVSLGAWAIHPEPEQTIRAGEPPQPTLRAQRAGDTVTISWHAAWTGWRLERRRELGPGTWESVSAVTGHTHAVPVADGPWLFRLVK